LADGQAAMVLRVSWPQALAWRMGRQLLDPIGRLPPEVVVRRLCGVQAQVASSADLAVRLRTRGDKPGTVAAALADGRLIKTWAMRGTLHLVTPIQGADVLSLLAAGRTWERPSWQRYFGMPVEAWARLRPVVRNALEAGPLTREELVAAIVREPGLGHLEAELLRGWGSLLKPLAWQGDLCYGPSRGNRVSFTRPEAASPDWPGLPDPDEAGPRVIAAYLAAYGPNTLEGFHGFLSRGWMGARRLRGWFAALGDRRADVDVEGERRSVLAEDLDDLAAARPTSALRLLGGFDQFVLGPGTDDVHVITAGRRPLVSKQSGWIAPIVVLGGVVAGTWELADGVVRVGWFEESGPPAAVAIAEEAARLGSILGRPLEPLITMI
jgi:Winged helix DNA-binding domain